MKKITLKKFNAISKPAYESITWALVADATEFNKTQSAELDDFSKSCTDYIFAKMTISLNGIGASEDKVYYAKLSGVKNTPCRSTTNAMIELIYAVVKNMDNLRTRAVITFNEETFLFPSQSWNVERFRQRF